MQGSEAARVREEGITVERRVLEYMELSSFGNINTSTLITDDSSTVPRQGPRMTTNLAYWGIRDVSDWNQCADQEMSWLMQHPHEVRPLLDGMSKRGWSATANAVEMGLNLMMERPAAVDFDSHPPASGATDPLMDPLFTSSESPAFVFAPGAPLPPVPSFGAGWDADGGQLLPGLDGLSYGMFSGEGSAALLSGEYGSGSGGVAALRAGSPSDAGSGSGSGVGVSTGGPGNAGSDAAAATSPAPQSRPVSFLEASRRGAKAAAGAAAKAPAHGGASVSGAGNGVSTSSSSASAGAAGSDAAAALPRNRRGRRLRPGDWLCPACGDHQFARNDSCRVCDTPKPADVPGDGAAPGAATGAPGTSSDDVDADAGVRRGDKAPGSPSLGSGVGSGKPTAAQVAAGLAAAPSTPGTGTAGGKKRGKTPGKKSGSASGTDGSGGGGSSGSKFKLLPGDWICGNCGDHQFARNSTCRMCGARRTDKDMAGDADGAGNDGSVGSGGNSGAGGGASGAGAGGGSGAAGGGAGAAGAAGGAGSVDASKAAGRRRKNKKKAALKVQDMLPGDWNCPSCGDHQFARNATCRLCGQKRPGDGKSR